MENVGAGELELPEQEMHTTAFWLTLPHAFMASLPYHSTDKLDGVNGLANALEAIGTLLVMCDARDLGRAVGENSRIQESAERSQESEVRSQNELGEEDKFQIRNLKSRTKESQVTVELMAFEPNIYLYDKYPGGVGLSEPLFRMSESLLEKTQRLIANCPCQNGCPSCVGPIGEIGEKGKEVALEILRRLSLASGL